MFRRPTQPIVDIDQYLSLIEPQLARDLTSVAGELQHLRFVHINSTATGGGVAEILQSLVPLMNALGVSSEWVVVDPPEEFFQVTKRIHNLTQGEQGTLSPEEIHVYVSCIRGAADFIQQHQLGAEVWFLHDPQLLPLASLLPKTLDEIRFWVCHIDWTAPNMSVLNLLLPFTRAYDGLVFSRDSYVPPGLDEGIPVYIAPPAIDPLSPKNVPLDEPEATRITAAMGIDPGRPLVTQVSRFDPWKDPRGVIDAYRSARQAVPGLQLALLGLSQASDDPQALEILDSVTEYAAGDPDIHLYFYPEDLPDTIDNIVNAFQVASCLIIQKSIREGFGLTVTEAMWKGKVVLGGNVGGIRLQIEDGVTGYLVDSAEMCSRRIIEVERNTSLQQRMGEAARESVRQKFLLPRLALDYLRAAAANVSKSKTNSGGEKQRSRGFGTLDAIPL